MRLTCPNCGPRDSREFTYKGSAKLMDRPESGLEDFHEYVHLRTNAAGPNTELWHHVMGCSAWLRVVRNTVTHEVISVAFAKDSAR